MDAWKRDATADMKRRKKYKYGIRVYNKKYQF